MVLLLKIIVLIVGVVVGVSFMKYSYPLTQLFGTNTLAERFLGNGGTYSMWKLLGVLLIIGAIWYAI